MHGFPVQLHNASKGSLDPLVQASLVIE